MKTHLLALAFVSLLAPAPLGCGTPPPANDVSKAITDAVACGLGVVATAEGTIDVQGLLACGLTVADALKLLQDLRVNAMPDAGASVSPARVAYAKKLDVAITTLKGM